MTQIEWNRVLTDQLTYHWEHQLRPRLTGLTDAEYLWEPVPGSWNVRPPKNTDQPGSGPFTIDWEFPEPAPPPVTTIAWRIAHIVLGVFRMRVASHFGGPPAGYDTWPYAGTAAEALDQLDEAYAAWLAGVRGLGEEGLARPCGPAEGPFAESPLADLVTHIHREVIHHGAEISLLRDLHAHRFAADAAPVGAGQATRSA
jgi:DinB superfamily